jgi:hypothetical protein
VVVADWSEIAAMLARQRQRHLEVVGGCLGGVSVSQTQRNSVVDSFAAAQDFDLVS